MKKLLFSIALTLLFFGCSNGSKEEPTETTTETVTE